MKLTYKKAEIQDAELLIEIYNASFYEDFIKYGECPAYGRTKENMEHSIKNFPKFIIMNENIPIGVISYENKGNGLYYIGCLCVIPKYQRKGAGTSAINYFLSVCPDLQKVELITPSDKIQNIEFYTKKCGFIEGKKMKDGNVDVVLLYKNK